MVRLYGVRGRAEEGTTGCPSRAQGPLCILVTGAETAVLCGHRGSTVDKQDLKPIWGQHVEAAACWSQGQQWHLCSTKCSWERASGPLGQVTWCPSPQVADEFLTAWAWLINSSQILRPSHISSINLSFNLFKFNGKTYGGERKANLK